jgi:hypothetical protein
MSRVKNRISIMIGQAVKMFSGVSQTWWDCDASLVEINPLCVVADRAGNISPSPVRSQCGATPVTFAMRMR